MTKTPPATMTKNLSCEEKAVATSWWRTLTPGERESLRDGRFPEEIIGRFVEPGGDEQLPEDLDLPGDYYEYVVAHEIVLWPERTFSIGGCTAHIAPRRCLAHGRIPASFTCPFAKVDCPMRVLLDQRPGFDVELTRVTRRSV